MPSVLTLYVPAGAVASRCSISPANGATFSPLQFTHSRPVPSHTSWQAAEELSVAQAAGNRIDVSYWWQCGAGELIPASQREN